MVGYNCILHTYHITAKLLIVDAFKHGAEVDQKDIAATIIASVCSMERLARSCTRPRRTDFNHRWRLQVHKPLFGKKQ